MNLDMVTAVFVGLLAGWLASFVMKTGPYGVIGDLVLGCTGGIAGGGIVRASGLLPGLGLVPMVVMAFVGAAGLLVAQRKLWHPPTVRPTRRRSVASGAWRVEQQ
ncbi:MAG: GlsB/YeaQ/YmgE family stress response membrane protein [Candidatus Rokubacteria bacterium]|nr:GlsB/YeaQ/YmgE family stress response membrane protein [Candidatus Rokubacteria bacterium]